MEQSIKNNEKKRKLREIVKETLEKTKKQQEPNQLSRAKVYSQMSSIVIN